MNYLKIHLKHIGIFLLTILMLNTLFSTLYLYTNMSSNTNNTLVFFSTMILTTILGFKSGIKTHDKGYINGIKLGLILVSVLFVPSLFFKSFISISKFLYYLILVMICTLASIVGKNMQKK